MVCTVSAHLVLNLGKIYMRQNTGSAQDTRS
jgi:hypothetical protein